jgi:hypothetical protein
MIIYLLLLQNLTLSTQIFEQISHVVHVQNDQFIISTKSGDFHAHIYDATRDSITYSFIRNGGGPGEARSIESFADCGDGTFVFLSSDGKLLIYDKEYMLIVEHQTIQSSGHSLFCSDNKVTIGFASYYRIDQIQSDTKFPVGITYNVLTGEKISEAWLRGADIFLGENVSFRHVQLLMIDFYVAHISSEKYLIAINGSPVFYLIEDDTLKRKYIYQQIKDLGFTEVQHPAYGYGQRRGLVNTNWQITPIGKDTIFRLGFGGFSEKIDYGYAELTINIESDLEIHFEEYDRSFQSELFELKKNMIIVSGGNTRLIYHSMPSFANYLYVKQID